jgi:fatty acid desaturase
MSILAGSPFSGSSYPTHMEQNLSTQFGLTWPMIVVQVLWLLVILAAILLAIRATLVSVRTFRGALVPLWVLLCWLLPVIGPMAALAEAKKQAQAEGRQSA